MKLQREVALSRSVVFAILSFFFGVTNVIVPLWALPAVGWQRVVAAAVTILAGVAWAYGASGTMSFSPTWRSLKWPGISLAIVLALNARALVCDVPWRGDEDYHIEVVNGLADTFHSYSLLFLICLAPVLLALVQQHRLGARGRISLRFIGAVILCLAVAATGMGLAQSAFKFMALTSPFSVARYPLLVSWLATVPVVVAGPFLSGFHEVVYRVVPVAAAALLVAACVGRLTGVGTAARVLYALVLASIPTIYYYSSILYLEMPAVLLMTIVCLKSDDLLRAGPAELMAKPAWYALVLVGFVKETTIFFLGAFLCCRVALQIGRATSWRERVGVMLRETRVCFCVLLPLAAYLVYRVGFYTGGRPFAMTASMLGTAESYTILLLAFWQQFGVAALLFPVGLVMLWRRGRRASFTFQIVAFVGYMLFQMLNRETDLYLGYSRFMLFFAPMIVSGVHQVVDRIPRLGRAATAFSLAAVAAVNLLMSPVHLDGAKQPYWGQYREDTSEHYYPYRAAIRHVQRTYPNDKTLVTGLHYEYRYELYTGATDRFALLNVVIAGETTESAASEQLLALAKEHGFQHVLYHVLGPTIPRPANLHGFVEDKVFSNSAHILVLYSVRPL